MDDTHLNYPLFVILGPSGSGKTRVTEVVFPKNAKIITHTTRPIRSEEKEKVDYYFESENSFQQLFNSGQLVEQDTYHGYHYGVSASEILERTASQPAYAILTYNGLKKVSTRFPNDIIVIFFDVTKEHVKQRLAQRESNPQLIHERLSLYDQEILLRKHLSTYPTVYLLNANQSFNTVVKELATIVKKASSPENG